MARSLLDPEQLRRDLSVLGESYHADCARIVGGEPLLHPGLLDVIAVVRESGIADSIRVATNGVLLPRMDHRFWDAVDGVHVSLYPGQELSVGERTACAERAAAARVSLQISRVYLFRESYSELGTTNERLVRKIYASCDLAHVWHCHTVANGHFFKCPPAYFLPQLLPVEGPTDGLRIERGAAFREELLRYLESPTPLASCRYCLGSAGKRFAHAQTPRRDFRARQSRTTEELVDRARLYPSMRAHRNEGLPPERLPVEP
jgi:hypothetical protein